MKKVIYFTAGDKPTTGEQAEIDALNALAALPYNVVVRNGARSTAFGAGIEAADYVAGTIPTAYNDAETYPVFDPDAPPAPDTLPATQAVVSDAQVLDTDDGGTVTLTIAGGAITSAVYAAP